MIGWQILVMIGLQMWVAWDVVPKSLPLCLFFIGCAVANFGIYLQAHD